ncbi:helix-turn-helix transcriptional regulator [Candidatus Pacearchaeota archaeon]|nr:helix-turn-helix transcriptional regulator [Candidatus Pacearchaeota archaeon]
MINRNILKHLHNHEITEEELYDAYKLFFGTLVSEPRLKILNLLKKGKKNVSEIMQKLNMDQTSVSHNLIRLKRCGFVNTKIEGRFRYYSINNETIKPLMDIIDKHMSRHCIHILRAMKGGNE